MPALSYNAAMDNLNERIIDAPLKKALEALKQHPESEPLEFVKSFIASYYIDGGYSQETVDGVWRYNKDYVADCIKAGRTLGLDPEEYEEDEYEDEDEYEEEEDPFAALDEEERELVDAFAELCAEEPKYTGDYHHIAKNNLFMAYCDKNEPNPSMEDWARQFMARGYHKNIVDDDIGEVMDYLEENYRFVRRFMFSGI